MTKIFGHRGLSSKYPENSLEAFVKAYEGKMDGVELDVHMTKDGELVVIHDFLMNKTTNGEGSVGSIDYNEIKKLYLKKNNIITKEKIPSLREVFEIFSGKNFEINIEIKAGYRFYKNIEEKLIKCIHKYYDKDKIIVSSFDHYSLVRIKEINSSLKTGALTEAALYNPWEYLNNIYVDYYHPNYITLTENFINEANKNNININTYTVDNPNIIKNLIEKNINIIITNKLFNY